MIIHPPPLKVEAKFRKPFLNALRFFLQDGNSLFVMTNMVITPKQYQGKCPEDPESYRSVCKTNQDCQQGTSNKYGHGKMI